ncbi:hypothetical protein FA13DRAFT_1747587 [Coprinellus micaceus]|uniref:Uncharacterized protein n=1 Tax=Coprinellus micaceus TaxID=71717 RepID=A0A4Y7S2K8_COPMI|nr:hypothetical protein FA13DRAFT_1747587 [Coprinellus micaceus]
MPCQSRLKVQPATHESLDYPTSLAPSRGVSLRTALTGVRYLTLNQLTVCAFTFRDARVLDIFFQSIRSMSKLKRITLGHFALPDPNHPPRLPACLANSPIPIKALNIHHTHGEALSFLFECFEPENLLLESCCFSTSSSGGTGGKLTIDSCPFLDEMFVKRLRGRSGPGVNIFFHGYGYEVWRRIEEFQDLRWRLEMQ